jgi:hypothetical protein
MVGAFHCFFIDPNNGNTTTGRRIPLFFIDPNNGNTTTGRRIPLFFIDPNNGRARRRAWGAGSAEKANRRMLSHQRRSAHQC